MKKIVFVVLTLLVVGGLFAQTTPQPAFRLLDGYLEKRRVAAEYGAKTGPWVLIGTGVAMGAASAVVWYAGDSIGQSAGVGAMNPEVRFGTTLGLGIGAAVLTGVGVALNLFPPAFDERARYSAIYQETDPTLQETMAAARLKGMAETEKDSRLVSGWVNLSLAGGSFAFQVISNQQLGRSWGDGLFNSWGWPLGSVMGGVTSLVVKSPEETLYEEYLYIVAQSAKN